MSENGQGVQAVWNARTPGQKKAIMATLVVASVFGVIYWSASGKIAHHKDMIKASTHDAVKGDQSLLFDGDTLERDLYDRLQAELEDKSKQLDEARADIKAQSYKMDKVLDRLEAIASRPAAKATTQPKSKPVPRQLASRIDIPPPPPPPSADAIRGSQTPPNAERVFASPVGKNNQPQDVDEVVGGIGRVTSDAPVEPTAGETGKKNGIHLAPSFMEAVLLSGMDAPITGDAKQNPKPTMLRIAAPAVLPNRVKANLKGCFVIASGYGSLAEERINLRLIRLSCVARNGDAVIEEKIKGYVVDSDGKVGLHARVYMKAGPHLVREFIAGVAEGVAEVVKQQSTTTSISALGTTQSIEPGKAANAGIAGGFSSASHSLSDFYRKLSEQTLPTLEVGPKKRVTVVLTEGVDLHIRDNSEDMDHGA